MKRTFFYLALVLVTSQPVNAQVISGKVTDSNTKQPLVSAHIASPESGEGTITDEGGEFRFNAKDITRVKTLVVSFVGYRPTKKVLLQKNEPLHIELSPDTTLLKGIEIRVPNALELIRKAIKQIPSNHSGSRLLRAFYRKTTNDNEKHIHVAEVLYDWNQSPGKYHQIKVLKARRAQDNMAFNGVGMGIGTSVHAVKGLDLTMDPSESFLKEKNLKKHTFFYEGLTTRQGAIVHQISFDQNKSNEALYRGSVFLDTASLAFVTVEYGLSPKGIKEVKVGNAAERAAMNLLDIDINVNAVAQSITYRPYGGQWYPDRMVMTEDVRVRSRRFNFDVQVTDKAEFLVTDIDTSFHRAFDEAELIHKGFLESSADTAKSFWEDHNIIPTQVNYNAVAKDIEGRNGHANVKSEVREHIRSLPKDKKLRMDSILTFYHRRGLFNGSALIKHRGKIILNKGYGFANREAEIPNDSLTIFRIGSVAKTFTSRMIWELKQDGLLHYEDSIQRFVPWYPHHGITVHHLLTHSSGIPNYMTQANFLDSIQYPFSVEELISHFGIEKPTFAPGTDFKYSNTGYTLLALIAEKASGKKFADLLNEIIFQPLHLNHTYFGKTADVNKAFGYLGNSIEPPYAVENAAGGGSIYSSTGDLLKWSDAHKDEKFDELFQPRTWYADWGSHYGYGWNIDKYQFWSSKKHVIQYHGGTDLGFKSILVRQPDKDNVVILLNNTGEFPLFDITDVVFRELN